VLYEFVKENIQKSTLQENVHLITSKVQITNDYPKW
jgi:hypothetical protein